MKPTGAHGGDEVPHRSSASIHRGGQRGSLLAAPWANSVPSVLPPCEVDELHAARRSAAKVPRARMMRTRTLSLCGLVGPMATRRTRAERLAVRSIFAYSTRAPPPLDERRRTPERKEQHRAGPLHRRLRPNRSNDHCNDQHGHAQHREGELPSWAERASAAPEHYRYDEGTQKENEPHEWEDSRRRPKRRTRA